MIFSRRALKNYATMRTDVLATANAIANNARRRHDRREAFRAIAPIAAFAIGIVLCIATIVTLLAAPDAGSLWSDAFNAPYTP
jgi:hypothetical protein